MSVEYLIVDAVILLPTLALALWGPWVTDRRDVARMFIAAVVASVPFIVWDALVAGHHWSFNPSYTLGVSALGLPIEEWLFFVAVPFACLFTWTALTPKRPDRSLPSRQTVSWIGVAALCVSGAGFLVVGQGYTGLVLLSAAAALTLDAALGTHVVARRSFGVLGLMVVGWTAVFNGYLTARPVVLYSEQAIVGWRVGTIPIEDFAYGLALILCTTAVYEALRSRKTSRSWLERGIERKMGGYCQMLPIAGQDRGAAKGPPASTKRGSVAVIGGGLAGVSAASYLAEAGLQVVLYERNDYLGGKLSGWRVEHQGKSYPVEHGFHAFFRHYYNLNDFLARIGADENLRSVGRYSILKRDGRQIHFDEDRSAPGLNLIELARRGMYDLKSVARPQIAAAMMPLLQYDEDRTFAEYDHVSYQEFVDRVRLPEDLSLAFTTFARAFFADADRLSLAELIKSFHFYYLSHDLGLVYDYMDGNVEETLIGPMRSDLVRRGVEIRLGEAPETLTQRDTGGFEVGGRQFDRVVVATDVGAAGRLLDASGLPSWNGTQTANPAMQSAQGYAVWRLWLPQRIERGPDLPVFVATERDQVLDAVAFVDRLDPELRRWADEHNGSVIELHCYAVPTGSTESELRDHFRRELEEILGVSQDLEPIFEFLRVAHDFTALHVGMHASRPETHSGIDGLFFAGDWVRLPCPAMLMEAAHLSGRLAANAILSELGLPTVAAFTVPKTGLFSRAA